MRLLFLNRSFWPDHEATGQLLTELCSDLAAEHEVAVVAGPSSHAQTSGRGLLRQDGINGVRITRTWGTTLPKRHLAGRLSNLASYYCLASLAALRMPKPDVVIAETDPPLLGLLGAALKARWHCRFIYYCQDLYPDVALATGGLRNPALLRLLSAANRLAYARADAIVALGRDMRARLLNNGVQAEKVTIVNNWADCRTMRAPADNAFRRQFGDQFVVMYSGNIGLSQGFETILAAADRLRDDPRVLFVLIGDGALKPEVETRAHKLQLRNVRLLPYQPKERLAESLAAADLHLVPLRRGVYGCLVPSKVYGILAVGRPFVAMMEEQAEAAMIAREYSAGYVTPPDDAEALAAVIRRARQEPGELARMGERGRKAAEAHFDRRTSVRKFAALLRNVVMGEASEPAVMPPGILP